MSIEGVVDVEGGEGLLSGRKYSYQGRGRDQTKVRLTKETILLGKLKGPRSRQRNPSTLMRPFFAVPTLLLLLAGTTTLDTWLRLPGLPAVNVMKMEVPVLLRIERTSAPWMWAGENLAASRFCKVLLLDVRLPRSFVEEPLQSQGATFSLPRHQKQPGAARVLA
jgi:hypothetical protein